VFTISDLFNETEIEEFHEQEKFSTPEKKNLFMIVTAVMVSINLAISNRRLLR
jgi:hypothetical protein